jgi:hypothetical protein
MIKGPAIEWTRTAAALSRSGLGGYSRVRPALDLLPQRRSQIRRNAAIAVEPSLKFVTAQQAFSVGGTVPIQPSV